MAEEVDAAAAWPGLVLLHHCQILHFASGGQSKTQGGYKKDKIPVKASTDLTELTMFAAPSTLKSFS